MIPGKTSKLYKLTKVLTLKGLRVNHRSFEKGGPQSAQPANVIINWPAAGQTGFYLICTQVELLIMI